MFKKRTFNARIKIDRFWIFNLGQVWILKSKLVDLPSVILESQRGKKLINSNDLVILDILY